MALLDHDKVVFQAGFGVRELGKPEKVDESTLFMAASNTERDDDAAAGGIWWIKETAVG